jgi:hypothetical protein
MSSKKIKHYDGFYKWKVKYIVVLVPAEEGILVKMFVIKLGVVPSELVLWSSIVCVNSGNIIMAEELMSHQETKLSHPRMSLACRRKDMQIHINLNMSVSLIKFTICEAYE